MYGSFESIQSAEVSVGDDSAEIDVEFTMNCVCRGRPAQLYGPAENCYPAEGAEFELNSIAITRADGKSVSISERELVALIGQDRFNAMLETAEVEAGESGEF